ncbi:BTB/POZ domain-containing protein 17 isoform X2 [Aethina tumida]|uniref:BTB/POZ domain-containing protein 17 isoform X2 n=1 Tax=Aethina tumida TaxID=116153 RepID=UPI00096B3E6F|nr:BTB/POZ domain-containing protein 17 isoform X2 [Aethina tumida]XP_049821500.1 BTB/POZ domain-containing protein 17 isoform X2 [Aethina tumida]
MSSILVDNSEIILRTLKKLYQEKQMCDVFLKVGGKEFSAHRLILCATSDVFQAMLMKPEWSEWHQSNVELQELPQCEGVFHLFLEYFYTGKIHITHTNVMPILALADKYIVKSLSRLCLKYMCNHVPHAASHNQLSSWLQYSTACGHHDVAKTCQNYIKWNFEAVANTPDYNNFQVDVFIWIIQQSDLVVYNEMVLYNCVVRWLELQKIKIQQSEVEPQEAEEQFKNLLEMVMGYIRFPMMTPRELADILISPMIKHHKEFFVDRMTIGMNYHNGHIEQLEKLYSSEEDALMLCPRLYTTDSCSTILTIENYGSVQNYHTSTFVFSSHVSAAEYESHIINEWLVDLYPKGVWFKKCYLIVWQGTLEVPEKIIPTVRLSLTSRELPENNSRVKVSVLVYGMEGGVEHVMAVKEKLFIFTSQDRVINFDDLIPYEDLNRMATTPDNWVSPYLVGPNRDQLKLNLVIAPIR